MSMDVVSPMVTIAWLRKRLDEATAATEQAERAQKDAEEQARDAEERATQAEEDRDGWANFARDLAGYHLIDQYASDKLSDDNRLFITEELYEQWAHGTKVWDLNAETLVNGAEGR